MVDNFLPAFDMKKEKEIKKDENIDAQISKIREDINNRKKNDKYFHWRKKILLKDQEHKYIFQILLN